MKIKTIALIPLVIFISIVIHAIIFYGIFNPVTATSNNTAWTKYSNSSNGVFFEYPATWKVKYSNESGPTITVFNPLNIENKFVIGLPNQNLAYGINLYPSLHEAATNMFGKINGTNIIEPFTEKIINGFHSTIGKVATVKQKSTQIILIHNGQLYTLSYSDIPNKYDAIDSQVTMKRIIQSFNIDK